MKYISILRKAKKNNKNFDFPRGTLEMISQAKKAHKMIQVINKPPPILDASEKQCYNSMRSRATYADEAYKNSKVKIIDEEYMDQAETPMETRDFDANRYMNHENTVKGLLTIQCLAHLLENTGLGLTEGPTIETFSPEGRQATSFYYSWTWAKEFRRICGICTKPK